MQILSPLFLTLIAITLAPLSCRSDAMVRSASYDAAGAFSFGIGLAVGGIVIISAV